MSRAQQTLAVLSHLAGRFRSWRAGVQYAGKRDIYQVAGYVREPKFDDYWALFERDGLARRIVEMPPKTTWREPPEIVEEGEDETAFTKAFTDLATRLDLWREFQRLDTLAGVGRYAILLIGTRGVDDQGLRSAAKPIAGPDDVLYLAAHDEGVAEVVERVRDPGDPRFDLPLIYKLRLKSAELRVHASRVLHVAEGTLRDRAYGTPRLQPVLNRLFDLEKVLAGTSEGVWQASTPILQAKVDPQAEITSAQLEDLDERLLELVHDLRRQFTGHGAELGYLLPGVTSPKDAADVLFSAIAGAAGIPKRILFGAELGELASTTDQQTYFGTIAERQRQFAEPTILRAFVDRMIEWRALPAPETGGYQIIWPTLFKETEKETADANLTRAQAAAALTPVGGDPREIVEVDEDRNVWLLPQTPDEAAARTEELQLGPTEPPDAPEP